LSGDRSGAEATPPHTPPRRMIPLTSVISYFLMLPISGIGVGGFAGVFDVGRALSRSLVWPLDVVALPLWSFLPAAPPDNAARNEPHSLDSVAPIFV
jgi:hypothetical protein